MFASSFPNIELLRSPHSILGNEGLQGFTPVDLSIMPDDEYRLLLLLASQAGRPDDKSVKYGMNGVFQSLYPDVDGAIEKLRMRGYFRKLETREIMRSFTIANLRNVAALVGVEIKSRMKRNVLFEMMVQYVDEQPVKEFVDKQKWLELSEKGRLLAKSLYAERDALERRIYSLLLDGNDQIAISTWAAYKSRQYGEKYNGMSKLHIANVSDMEQRAMLACYEIYGTRPMFYPIEEPTEESVFKRDIGRAETQIKQYMEAGILKYQSMCVCDVNTCNVCASHDGIVSETKIAKIGPTEQFKPFDSTSIPSSFVVKWCKENP